MVITLNVRKLLLHYDLFTNCQFSNGKLSLGRGTTRRTNRRGFSNTSVNDGFLDGNLLAESLQGILSFELLELSWSVLVQEFVQREVTTANSDFNVIFLDLDSDSLGSELVDSLGLTHEHDLELGSFRVVIDEFSQLSIDWILLDWDVNSNSLLQVDDVLLEGINFNLSILELLQELKRGLVSLVNFFLKFKNVVSSIVKFSLEILLLSEQFLVSILNSCKLGLNIFFLSDDLLETDDSGLV